MCVQVCTVVGDFAISGGSSTAGEREPLALVCGCGERAGGLRARGERETPLVRGLPVAKADGGRKRLTPAEAESDSSLIIYRTLLQPSLSLFFFLSLSPTLCGERAFFIRLSLSISCREPFAKYLSLSLQPLQRAKCRERQ